MQVITARRLKHEGVRAINCDERAEPDHPVGEPLQRAGISSPVNLFAGKVRDAGPGIGECQAGCHASLLGETVCSGNAKAGRAGFCQGEGTAWLSRCAGAGECLPGQSLPAKARQRPVRKPQ